MQASLIWSMAAFALATSISPGPVNVVALSTGVRLGFRASLPHVTGATVGFTALLLLAGLGLHELLGRHPSVAGGMKWGGILFLGYLACRLASDDGSLSSASPNVRSSWWQGAAMQWLNPKAWLAAVAGTGAYAAEGSAEHVWVFAAIYFWVCYISVACWAYVGTALRRYLEDSRKVRLFNRAMAVLLLISAGYLALD